MMIQIFGTKKCRDTQKALRFFKERRIDTQFIDLAQKDVSKGELNSISRSVPLNHLIDTEGREYDKRNLKYLVHDVEEQLLEHPLLFRTPIVRYGKKAAVGNEPDTWKIWAAEIK
ncbi:MAG: ArsC family transcriptional regulator [bacterium]|nr:ArsC family transcriptional regulator [bacterium]